MLGIVYNHSSPFVAFSNDGLTFRKELCKKGTWEKGKHRFEIDEAMLSHWARTHAQLLENGVNVHMMVDHTSDPEKARGTILSMEAAPNDRGEPALFGICKFADEESAKLAKRTDVSIYSPPEFKDGKGTTHHRPIMHVALTTQPVITGLSPFQTIACSHVPEKVPMSLSTLAQKLEVSVSEDATDDVIEDAIVAAFTKLKGKPEEKKDPPQQIAAAHISMLRDNRTMKIDKLLDDGKITKAVRDDLVKRYTKDETISLALSHDASNDGFEDVLSTLSLNEKVVSYGGKTGAQVVKLSHGLKKGSEGNALVDQAKAKAERAAKR